MSSEDALNAEDHPLPDMLDKVLNGEGRVARSGGFEVERTEDFVLIKTYDEPPETGGETRVIARILQENL